MSQSGYQCSTKLAAQLIDFLRVHAYHDPHEAITSCLAVALTLAEALGWPDPKEELCKAIKALELKK